jgi:hypothetical protein
MPMKRVWLVVASASLLVGVGCSSTGDHPQDVAAAYAGHSYTVTAAVTPSASAAAAGPASHSFTMVFDAQADQAILGGLGSATVAPFTRTASGALAFNEIQFSSGTGVSGWTIRYTDMTIAIGKGGSLAGTAAGTVIVSVPGTDVASGGPVTATLAGGLDVVPPELTVSRSGAEDDPFSSLTVYASEPLPADARPSLVAVGGATTPLTPPDGADDRFTYVFSGPGTLLRYGQQYQVQVDGITDFVGLPATGGATFTTRAAPPLVAEDGFESVTTSTLGGAQVLTGDGAPTITGARSLYVPQLDNQGQVVLPSTTALALRLTVSPGDTVIRFSYRTVGASDGFIIYYASEGGKISWSFPGGPAAAAQPVPTETATIPGQGDVPLGPVTTAEIPLPPDVGSEIVMTLVRPGTSNLPPPPFAPGVIIDDLRVE